MRSLPTRQRTHATAGGAGVGREEHESRIEGGRERVKLDELVSVGRKASSCAQPTAGGGCRHMNRAALARAPYVATPASKNNPWHLFSYYVEKRR
jgi:hypothetical protein